MTTDTQLLVLENDTLRAEFDARYGTLVGLTNKQTGWAVQRRAELARSFKMMVPLPDRRKNYVWGEQHACTSVEAAPDGAAISFTWDGLQSEHGGMLEINFTGTATLTEDGLTFTGVVRNQSPYVVESVQYPFLGDLCQPAPDEKLYRRHLAYAGMHSVELRPNFANERGYYGTDHLVQLPLSSDTPFVLIDTNRQGLYVGVHDTSLAEMVGYYFEGKPGVEDRFDSPLPPGDEISGHPVNVEFSTIHFCYTPAGETDTLPAIVLQPYTGDWHDGADVYKRWRASWFTRPPGPAWVDDVHSWLQLQINGADDDLKYRYADLLAFGAECARHGVRAIQLVGWNNGGQDRGNPSHDTDPRLGSWEELRDAIAQIQALGVKMILFNKYTWSDRSTDWYAKELIKYATKDPYGDTHVHQGYQYQTPAQFADLNTRRFSSMCHLSAEWREIANTEFTKNFALGAAGMLYDECQHHGQARYCFDASHGHRVPAHVFAGDAPLAGGFHRIADELNPEFLFAGEACYDLELRHYRLSYFRTGGSHVPMHRYVDPFAAMMVGVVGYDARNAVNECLLYRYIISYEPLHFKGHLDDFPLTLAYGKLVDDLRTRYRAFLWDAEFRDTVGASVTVGDQPHPQYAVFRQLDTGKRAVIVTNNDHDQAITATVLLDGGNGSLLMATPEEPDAREASNIVSIPPRSVVVLMEA